MRIAKVLLSLLIPLSLSGCNKKPQPVTAEKALAPVKVQANPIDRKGYVLIAYGSASCSACRKMCPIVDALDNEDGKGGYDNIYMIDISMKENETIMQQQQVTTTPCLIIYKDGWEIERHTGVHTREDLIEWIKTHKQYRKEI